MSKTTEVGENKYIETIPPQDIKIVSRIEGGVSINIYPNSVLKRISDHYHLGLKIEEGKPE